MTAGALSRDQQQRRLEIGVGAAVVAACILLLVLLAGGALGGGETGTRLAARFDHIDGLVVGSDVRIAGVRIGRVTAERIDPASFLATVEFTVPSDIHLSTDSSASIVSEGLLGGKYLSLVPGGDAHTLGSGGVITATQGSIGLEALLGKFIGSVTALTDAVKSSGMAGGAPKPKAAPLGGDLGP